MFKQTSLLWIGVMTAGVMLPACEKTTTPVASQTATTQTDGYQVVRVYDIRDLLATPDVPSSPAENAEIITELIDLIKTNVAPKTWRDAGGQIGSARVLEGQLIIDRTTENQTEISKLLKSLRETRELQLQIEARLLKSKVGLTTEPSTTSKPVE